jgi:hypothetical protein
MINTPVMRYSGPTYTMDLDTNVSDALQIVPTTNDQVNYVSLLNTGTDLAAVEFANAEAVLVEPTIATTGNSGSFVLPGSMNFPLILAVPKGPFWIQAISSGTNTLYVTPIQAD